MLTVANPIYDAVFKYLLEDERVARTLLSALLQREVVEVHVRKHEYTNGTRDKISMFRIDFGAQVRQDDGSLKLILIELQKTWLETETLRFRQYLGTQYADPDNIIKEENPEGYGLPMITVYLLGHRVGDIEESVIYVRHKSYDYNGQEVTKGIPDPFVESLVHDSIIVQIPLLRGRVNNRLEQVLSVFDQTRKDKKNRQVLNLDETTYAGDEEMNRILTRLLSAASDAKVRQDMNVEEEYFQAIENRDTAIMMRDEKIKEQDSMIAEQSNQIAEQSNQIAEQSNQIAEQSNQIAEQSNQIAEQSNQIAEQSNQIAEQKNALLLTAKALKSAGFSIETLSSMTGLPIEEINEL